MNQSIQKREIRDKMILQRGGIPTAKKKEWDKKINKSLMKLAKDADYIHTYLPMDDEIDLYPFIEDCLATGKVVICPKSLPKGILKNLVLDSLDELESGVFGTRFPSGDNVFNGKYDLIIVPGLAFDADGYRIGYGGGYYDRFLAMHPGAHKVGACYSFQQIDDLPKESFDMAVDEVITYE